MNRAPVAGHISSLRAEQEQKKVTLKDASKKHIDPFTGVYKLWSCAMMIWQHKFQGQNWDFEV